MSLKARIAEIPSLSSWNGFNNENLSQVEHFYELLKAENQVQNLTKLDSIDDFIDGHLFDCVEVLKSNLLKKRCLDIGSGGGVPGLLCAILDMNTWVLTESEKRKADFIGRAAGELGLSDRVSVFPGRAEIFLEDTEIDTLTSRAIGSLEKNLELIGHCSTWNNLILFKGPKWAEEVKCIKYEKWKKRFALGTEISYETPIHMKQRIIAEIRIVPRGTKF